MKRLPGLVIVGFAVREAAARSSLYRFCLCWFSQSVKRLPGLVFTGFVFTGFMQSVKRLLNDLPNREGRATRGLRSTAM
ncbi:hypothetical protein ACTJKB_25315 [Paenibacillus sp. 22594]